MHRRIVGFVRGDDGEWVALLACLHRQHVRHQPPFRTAPWVTHEAGRASRVGESLDCPLCDRAELPADLVRVRVTDTWTESTMPAGLRRDHRLAGGLWGLLHVESGALRFRAETDPPIDRAVAAGEAQPIPPDVLHAVETPEAVRFFLEILKAAGADPQV
jgi:tellurite methyltransferase